MADTRPQVNPDASSEYTPLNNANDPDSLSTFSDQAVRNGFIRKVYGILGMQLVVTTAIGATIMHLGKDLVKSHPALCTGMLFTSMAMSVGMMCIFSCRPDLLRTSPQNYCILVAFTVAESVMVGFVSISYTKESVLIVLGLVAIIVLGLTLFACQTSIDFTGLGPYLFCGVMALMGMGFVFWIGSMAGLSNSPAFKTMQLIYAGIGVLVFSCYLVYDTQLIVGGKHPRAAQFAVDDYCAAAISLYMDIIQLFLFLLQLLGSRRQ